MSSTALPFLYVETDVPAGLTLSEFRRSRPSDERKRRSSIVGQTARRLRRARRLRPRLAL